MYVLIEENPNSSPEERVFAANGAVQTVKRVQTTPPQSSDYHWCDVTGVEENGIFVPARAVRVDDSADGTAWLVHGGAWGLRLKLKDSNDAWSLNSDTQWGLPFLVLDSSGSAMECV
jgi:hypothetical protein